MHNGYIRNTLHHGCSLYRSANECVLVHAVQCFVEGLVYPVYNVKEFREARNDGRSTEFFVTSWSPKTSEKVPKVIESQTR